MHQTELLYANQVKHVTMVTHDLVSMLHSFYFDHFECDINLLQVGLESDASRKVIVY